MSYYFVQVASCFLYFRHFNKPKNQVCKSVGLLDSGLEMSRKLGKNVMLCTRRITLRFVPKVWRMHLRVCVSFSLGCRTAPTLVCRFILNKIVNNLPSIRLYKMLTHTLESLKTRMFTYYYLKKDYTIDTKKCSPSSHFSILTTFIR